VNQNRNRWFWGVLGGSHKNCENQPVPVLTSCYENLIDTLHIYIYVTLVRSNQGIKILNFPDSPVLRLGDFHIYNNSRFSHSVFTTWLLIFWLIEINLNNQFIINLFMPLIKINFFYILKITTNQWKLVSCNNFLFKILKLHNFYPFQKLFKLL
jgi:hypothetical protein